MKKKPNLRIIKNSEIKPKSKALKNFIAKYGNEKYFELHKIIKRIYVENKILSKERLNDLINKLIDLDKRIDNRKYKRKIKIFNRTRSNITKIKRKFT